MILHININSIKNKFHRGRLMALSLQVNLLLSVLLHHLDLTKQVKEGAIFVQIRKDIHSKLLKTPYICDHTECLMGEINLLKTNWFLIHLYSPLKSSLRKY